MTKFHSNPRRWIVFVGETDKRVELTVRSSLTNLLAESYDSSGKGSPEIGYRPLEFVKVESEYDPSRHAESTHYKGSDWVVDRVEEYPANMPGLQLFDEIVVCYCKYSPVDSILVPMPDRIVSLDSFGGDQEAFDQWKASQVKQPVEV
jgi:hypothetical protein